MSCDLIFCMDINLTLAPIQTVVLFFFFFLDLIKAGQNRLRFDLRSLNHRVLFVAKQRYYLEVEKLRNDGARK